MQEIIDSNPGYVVMLLGGVPVGIKPQEKFLKNKMYCDQYFQ